MVARPTDMRPHNARVYAPGRCSTCKQNTLCAATNTGFVCKPCNRTAAARWRARDPERHARLVREALARHPEWNRYLRRRLRKTPAYREARKAAAWRQRHATLGRVCSDCGRTDRDTIWARRAANCAACARRRCRNGACPRCDAALYDGGRSCRKCARGDGA